MGFDNIVGKFFKFNYGEVVTIYIYHIVGYFNNFKLDVDKEEIIPTNINLFTVVYNSMGSYPIISVFGNLDVDEVLYDYGVLTNSEQQTISKYKKLVKLPSIKQHILLNVDGMLEGIRCFAHTRFKKAPQVCKLDKQIDNLMSSKEDLYCIMDDKFYGS